MGHTDVKKKYWPIIWQKIYNSSFLCAIPTKLWLDLQNVQTLGMFPNFLAIRAGDCLTGQPNHDINSQNLE